jgi:hypothetical protein
VQGRLIFERRGFSAAAGLRAVEGCVFGLMGFWAVDGMEKPEGAGIFLF